MYLITARIIAENGRVAETTFVTRLTLPEAFAELNKYEGRYNFANPAGRVQFMTRDVALLDCDLDDEALTNGRLDLIERLCDQLQASPPTPPPTGPSRIIN